MKNNINKLSRWTLASNTSNALPVKRVSFTAELHNRQTQLQWITTSEINSSYFDVQRSGDGINFNKLLKVPAMGNSNAARIYRSMDDNPLTGINYYRLKEVDLDGNSFLSPTVSVTLNGSNSCSIFPNPVSTMFWLDIHLSTGQQTVMEIYDTKGLLMQKRSFHLTAGNSRLSWDISGFAKGTYFLKTTNKSLPAIKVLKQ